MRFPDAYTIGQCLSTKRAEIAATLLGGILMAAIALTGYLSQEAQLYRSSKQAVEKFIATVETDYPRNRVTVLYALRDMRAAYEETGERDPARLGQLERLDDWLLRSHTAGEEQAFLTEVRTSEKVIPKKLWFSDQSGVLISIIAGFWVGFGILKAANVLLSRMDPRLRPSRAAGC